MDPVDLMSAPIPGQSLTTEPGNATWERPPQFTDPNVALEYLWEQMTKPRKAYHIGKMLKSGTPAEYIARTVVFAGFSEGKWNPDLALLISRPVLYQIVAIGAAQGVENIKIMNDREDALLGLFESPEPDATPQENQLPPKQGLLD